MAGKPQDLLEMSLTLPGAKWYFSNSSAPTKLYPAHVPSTFHLDLMSNKLVDDPYYRDNLLEFYKYEKEDWIYTRSFYVESDFATR